MAIIEDFRLKVFLAVAQKKSFTEAAEALNVTQPAVSQNISELEKSMDMKLFDRQRGNVMLTPHGEVFMKYALRVLSLSEEINLMFEPLTPAVVKISASEEVYTYYIYPLLESFILVHPEIKFERSLWEESDLKISLRPSTGSPYDIDSEVIAKLRISMWPAPQKMGDITATHEKSTYFDLLYQPSQAFACTKTCRLLKDYFASLL